MMSFNLDLIVKDSPLSATLFGEFVKYIQSLDGMDVLLTQGCDPKIVEEIRQLKARDLPQIAKKLEIRCNFQIDQVHANVQRLDAKLADQEMLEYFIRHGATRQMIANFWRMSMADVKQQRRLLLSGRAQPERANASDRCKPGERDRIQDTWIDLMREHPNMSRRDLIFELHKNFAHMSIKTVVRIAQECELRICANDVPTKTPQRSALETFALSSIPTQAMAKNKKLDNLQNKRT